MMTVTVTGLADGIGVMHLLQPTRFASSITDVGLTPIVLGAVLLACMASMSRAKSQVCA